MFFHKLTITNSPSCNENILVHEVRETETNRLQFTCIVFHFGEFIPSLMEIPQWNSFSSIIINLQCICVIGFIPVNCIQ